MKKTITIFMMLLLILALAGCGKKDTPSEASDAAPVAEESGSDAGKEDGQEARGDDTEAAAGEAAADAAEKPDGKDSPQGTLVVYFSRTGEQYGVGEIEKGNTAIVADMIIESTGADSFEILPADDYYPYTYDELTEIAKQEQKDNARPAIRDEAPDFTGYQTIFIGAPVWWGDWPMILYTFFENHVGDLAGKTLIPFCTHAGSGLSGFDKKLSAACPDSTVGKGLAIAGTDAQKDPDGVREKVDQWLSGLEY